jgi:predicted DNA-binding transcriptional regulator YafY
MMDPMDVIATEARAHRTIVLTARESDGSSETREVEPYSLRPGAKDRPELRLFYYCLKKDGTRNTYLSNIISAEPTGRPFSPRWPVEL